MAAGDRSRALGLALEHTAEFPEDADLLARVAREVADGEGSLSDRAGPPRAARGAGA
jgi:hypothetical protein